MACSFYVVNVITISIQKLGYSSRKKNNYRYYCRVFERGMDVFAILPIGFRKTLCYACIPSCIPLVFDGMDPLCDHPSIVLVITLLTAIIKDDVIAGVVGFTGP